MSIDRLTAEDRVMLSASRAWPQDIVALAVLDATVLTDARGRFRIDVVRQAIAARLHLVPRFRQLIKVPRRGLGGPVWVDAPTFDLGHHVRVRALDAPADESELLRVTEQLRRQRLDPKRPLWEMWFLTGLPDGRIGLFVKIHHTIGDGLAAMSIIARFLDHQPETSVPAPVTWTPRRWPSAPELAADNLVRRAAGIGQSISLVVHPRRLVRQIRAAWPAVRELIAEQPATKTSLDRVIGPERRFAIVRSPYRLVRRIGRRSEATVNDVLLAITAGGIRRLLRARGEPVDDVTVRIYVPVTLRHRLRGTEQGTQIAQMVVPLPIGEPDPYRRLRQIAVETARRKQRTRTSLGTLFRGQMVRGLLLKVVIRQRANVTSASVPGPTRARYLAGARMLEVVPLVALIGNVPLGVGAVSYAGTWEIGITADAEAFPDIEVLAAGMREELEALGLGISEPDDQTPATSPELVAGAA